VRPKARNPLRRRSSIPICTGMQKRSRRRKVALPPGASCAHMCTVMPERPRKRPRDPNQLAKLVVAIATAEAEDRVAGEPKNPHAVALGRLGGTKGGRARAVSLSAKKRSAIAKKAARTRWGNRENGGSHRR